MLNASFHQNLVSVQTFFTIRYDVLCRACLEFEVHVGEEKRIETSRGREHLRGLLETKKALVRPMLGHCKRYKPILLVDSLAGIAPKPPVSLQRFV